MDSSSNPFRYPLRLSTQPPAYLKYIYASISTCHRIIQRYYGDMHKCGSQSTELTVSTKSTHSLTDPDEAALYHYHASALKGLNEALSKATKSPPNVDILGGVMLILFSQVRLSLAMSTGLTNGSYNKPPMDSGESTLMDSRSSLTFMVDANIS